MPPVEKGEFRTVLGHFASGVVLVTGMHEGQPAGLTCQSFFSLSLEPPLVALAPGRSSTSWPRASSSGKICINVLAADQESLARTFSQSGADKFAGVGWSPAGNGAPRLHGALAWIDCSIEQEIEGGDHHLVTARVEDLETGSGQPLVFYRGGFGGFLS
jgi:3-hydroxy-9,10-secoandrosta-1,3,5(10)-triene-9,17-dione monooxygenase reductase component